MNPENITMVNNNVNHKESKIIDSKTTRKIYSREDFFQLNKCSKIVPEYLKDFPFLSDHLESDEKWFNKPIPKFEEIPLEVKNKSTYPNNKSKGRHRTLSNQSGGDHLHGDYPTDHQTHKTRTFSNSYKSNRGPQSPNEFQLNEDGKFSVNPNDFDDHWHKVESRSNRTSNSSKPYSHNIQLTENHWKKWSNKDGNNQSMEKNRPPSMSSGFRSNQSLNWTRRNEQDNRQRGARGFIQRQSVSKSGDQTEDIWFDDMETELKSEIGRPENDLNFDQILPITPPVVMEASVNLSQEPSPSLMSTSPNAYPTTVTDTSVPLSVYAPIGSPACLSFQGSGSPLPLLNLSPVTPVSDETEFEMWYYRDLSNMEQGPFSSKNMANWYATGYFTPATLVRRDIDDRYLLLAQYRVLYGRIPFTKGTTIPPIFIDTPINIDMKQLLVGVETALIPRVIKLATSPSVQIALMEEEKRILEMRAEIELERDKINQEKSQIQAMQMEMEEKMKYFQQQLIDRQTLPVECQSIPIEDHLIVTEEPVEISSSTVIENIPISNHSELHISNHQSGTSQSVSVKEWPQEQITPKQSSTIVSEDNNHWISTKDIKNQKKNKKNKNKIERNSKEEKETIEKIPESKRPDQPTDTRLVFLPPRESLINNSPIQLGNTVEPYKGKPIRFELDNRKNESNVVTSVATTPVNSLSLLEIQAEEIAKMQREKESQVNTKEIEQMPSTGNNVKSELDNRKTENLASWKPTSNLSNNSISTGKKSLLEIQAEEALKEKKIKEVKEANMAYEKEVNKVTSFKDSLLKTNRPIKPSLVPHGKSIWDMAPMDWNPSNKDPVIAVTQTPVLTTTVKKEVEIQNSKSNKTNKSLVEKKDIESEFDHLTPWCMKKLQRFSDKLDVQVVIELLKEVSDEDVMDLACQSLDDSQYTRSFVGEFIKKRQELSEQQTSGAWQTVKKPIAASSAPASHNNTNTANNNSSNNRKSAKAKSKKKLVPIDAKFK